MTYRAPVADIAFALKHGAARAQSGELGADDIDAIVTEAGRFATDVIAPLNAPGDKCGTPFKDVLARLRGEPPKVMVPEPDEPGAAPAKDPPHE